MSVLRGAGATCSHDKICFTLDNLIFCFIVLFGSTVIFVGVLLMYIVISCCIYIFTVIVHLNNTYVNY